MLEKYYPKNLWKTRANGSNFIMKATQEEMEDLFQRDVISDYSMLEVFKVKHKEESK